MLSPASSLQRHPLPVTVESLRERHWRLAHETLADGGHGAIARAATANGRSYERNAATPGTTLPHKLVTRTVR